MRTELHQKLFANVILSTKSEPLSSKRFRQTATGSGAVYYAAVTFAVAIALIALIFSKVNHGL